MAVRMLGSCHWIVGTSEAFVANAHDFGEFATLNHLLFEIDLAAVNCAWLG